MKGPYRPKMVVEVCPKCSHEWKGAAEFIHGKPIKRCPQCLSLWAPHQLLAHRRKLGRDDAKRPLSVMRQAGMVSNEGEALRIALIALLAGYDKAISTLPVGSLAQRLVQGAFGHAPALARGLV